VHDRSRKDHDSGQIAGNCTVDAYLTWPTMTAYFFHGDHGDRRPFDTANSQVL
jgi:hypothetical protein